MAVTIQFVTSDEALGLRVSRYGARLNDTEFRISDHPADPINADVIVAPIADAGELLASGQRSSVLPPVIAYGPRDALREAFDVGCADFLREPWTIEELTLRATRLADIRDIDLAWGRITVASTSLLSRCGRQPLTVHEYRVLRILLRHRGTAVPREVLRYAIGAAAETGSRSLDVHVSAIRRKLRAVSPQRSSAPRIVAARGIGYMLVAAANTRS